MISIRSVISLAVGFVCATAALTSNAELVATPLPGDSRLVQFNYDSDNTYLLLTRPQAVTHVELSPEEVIQTVAAGDSKNWEVTPTANRRHIFIKPLFDGIETSMTVLTDKRSYQFVLKSTAVGAKWYQRVTWRHDKTMLMDLTGEEQMVVKPAEVSSSVPPSVATSPENLKFAYEVTGNAPFKPVTIFDDGKFTWLKMPSDLQELPAVFGATEDDGDFLLVNYLVKGDYIQIQRRLDAGILKLGNSKVLFKRLDVGANSWVNKWWRSN